MLAQMLNRLADELGLSVPPTEDKKGTFSLPVGDRLLKMRDMNPGVYLWSQIIEIPGERREELFIHLMKANFLGQGTGDCVIGMDREEKFLTLSLTIPYEVNYEIFKEKIEDFINYLDYWFDEVVKHQVQI
ncbi:MAG: hypothetical protein SP1CHLAM54_17520 [Chlamydiia bacterium]|nr:hypothetical protein [Chlamydiia bacterium]MCH9616640.1 hypothetical protein [Chlamydiia bacterium]MCH9629371.1 hypothetical protein [Chlamydiia bacterium]